MEELEARCLLTGNPANAWLALGPAPQLWPFSGTAGVQPNTTTSGRVSALAVGQYGGVSVLYVGAAGGGVWRSNDLTSATRTWTPLTDNPVTVNNTTGLGAGAIDVGSIAVSGSNLYVGTGEANFSSDSRYGTGILTSTNGGQTFATIATGATAANEFFRNSVSKIINPSANVLVAAVVPSGPSGTLGVPLSSTWGVYQSTDNGATWAKVSSAATGLPDGSVVTDLDYFTMAGKTCVLAAVGNIGGGANNGVYLGTPQGGGVYTWTKPFGANFPSGAGVGRLALASDHTSTVYVASSTATGTFNNVSKAVLNGTTWTVRSSVGPSGVTDTNLWYNLALGLSPSGRLYLGMQTSVYESNPGVTNWQNIAGPAGGVSPHVDHHAFAFAPDGTVFEGDDGGVWRYNPGVFDPAITYSVGTAPVAIAATDFNPNNHPDLVTANTGSNDVTVLLGSVNSDGTFPTAGTTTYALDPTHAGTATVPQAIAIGDFNSDGSPDIVTANFSSNNVSILLNKADGTGTFPGVPPTYALASPPVGVAVGDFNGDGVRDLAATGLFGTRVLKGNAQAGNPAKGDGTFTSTGVYGVNLFPTAIAVGKVNNDRFDDIVLAEYNATTHASKVDVFINDGTGLFPANPTATYNVGADPTSVVLADVNGDGVLDIITTNALDNSVSILKGNANGTFQNAVAFAAGVNPVSVAAADFNVDGSLDLVVANQSANTVSILLGNGNGTFGTPVSYGSGGIRPTSVTTGLFNNDAIPDVAVANAGSNNIGILLSNAGFPRARTLPAWVDLNTAGLNITQPYGVGQDPGSRNNVLEGSQDNGVALTTNALAVPNTWTTKLGGDGMFVRFDPFNPANMTNFAYASTQFGIMYRSDDGGANWAVKTTGLPANIGQQASGFPFVTKFTLDPKDATRLLLASNTQVWETRNRGDNWTAISPAAPNQIDPTAISITALTYDPQNDNIIYAGFSDGKIYQTIDDGANWQQKGAFGGPVTAIVIDPVFTSYLYASINIFGSPAVWKSVDQGLNWTAFAGGL